MIKSILFRVEAAPYSKCSIDVFIERTSNLLSEIYEAPIIVSNEKKARYIFPAQLTSPEGKTIEEICRIDSTFVDIRILQGTRFLDSLRCLMIESSSWGFQTIILEIDED